jgi:hypothetical protein
LYSIIKFDRSAVNAVEGRNLLTDAKTTHEALLRYGGGEAGLTKNL